MWEISLIASFKLPVPKTEAPTLEHLSSVAKGLQNLEYNINCFVVFIAYKKNRKNIPS